MIQITWGTIYSDRSTTFKRINKFLTWLLMELSSEDVIDGWSIICQPGDRPEAAETYIIEIFCNDDNKEEILKIIERQYWSRERKNEKHITQKTL